MTVRRSRTAAVNIWTLLLATTLVAACRPRVTTTTTPPSPTKPPPPPPARPSSHAVPPIPAHKALPPPDSLRATPNTVLFIGATASPEVEPIGNFAANVIASSFGATAQRLVAGASVPDSGIVLTLDPSRGSLTTEGYELTATKQRVQIVAAQPAGLFYGVQTLRQLFPAAVELRAGYHRRLIMPAGHVVDPPRFEWRGAVP